MGLLLRYYGMILMPVPGMVVAGVLLNNLTPKQPLVAMIVKCYSYCVQTANTGLADEMATRKQTLRSQCDAEQTCVRVKKAAHVHNWHGNGGKGRKRVK